MSVGGGPQGPLFFEATRCHCIPVGDLPGFFGWPGSGTMAPRRQERTLPGSALDTI